jgi:hypothetical protein
MPEANFTSEEFKKIKISLGSLMTSDPWFLGALYVEGLKKGCADEDKNWTPLYFNPFLRTWISEESPLIVSEDDAVAVFATYIGDREDAGTSNDIAFATPFETKDAPLYNIDETPTVRHNFERGQKYFTGRTYFAENQGWTVEEDSRLKGRFSDLLPTDISKGFRVYIVDGADGIYFEHFHGFLMRPIFKLGTDWNFQAYAAGKSAFWLDPEDGRVSAYFWGGINIPILNAFPEMTNNLGEKIVDQTPMDFLNWAIQNDNP